MNRWDIQQNSLMVAGCEEKSFDRRGHVVCPKPRRLGFLGSDLTMCVRWQRSNQTAEIYDSKAGAELLDIILMREGYGEVISSREISSSPPFFCGSPPSRVSNPVVHDANFRDQKLSPLSTLQQLTSPSSSSSTSGSMSPSAMKSGCPRMNFGLKPAPIRVEGFDCLSQNNGITAMA